MLNWYVMRSKSNKEELLYQQLLLRQIETYYPCIKAHPVNPRSLKIKPYFPGYMFIKVDFDILGTSALQWLPGAMSLLNFGGEFATVNDNLLQAIRRKVDHINAMNSGLLESLKPGDIVSIHSGPFAGYRGIFDSRLTGHERVRVLLQMLRDRQVSVELPINYIERAKEFQYSSGLMK